MKHLQRPLAVAIAILAALLIAGAAAAAARAIRGARASDTATVAACTTGATAAQRSATFSAEMSAVPGTRMMAVSFDLYERTSTSGSYVAVSAPGFGVWQTSNRGIASFTANENVVDLPASAAFRALVHYRWLDRRGGVIRSDVRVTKPCVEMAPEPDLFILRITHAAGSPPKTSELYGVVVRNSGPGAAGPFEVAFTVNGTALADQQVAGLDSKTRTTVQFSGPRCTAGSTMTAQVDPAGAINEPANPSRTITMTCSDAATSGASGDTGT